MPRSQRIYSRTHDAQHTNFLDGDRKESMAANGLRSLVEGREEKGSGSKSVIHRLLRFSQIENRHRFPFMPVAERGRVFIIKSTVISWRSDQRTALWRSA